jgi:poly-gamma-glutamate synthesis protein (capsule biosynthesis protein)
VTRSTAAALAGVVLALTACSGSRGPSAEASVPVTTETGGTAPRSPSTTSQATPTGAPARRTVTIALAGDIHFEGVLARRLAEPATALAPVTRTLAAADLAIANLETSVGTGGTPEPGKRFVFSAPATVLGALTAAGLDVVSMANNHALDHGRDRLPSTFDAIEAADLAVVGIGPDVDAAFRPALTEHGGTVVATLAASVADQDVTADPTGHWAATATVPGIAVALDPTRLLTAVRRADQEADVVVVYLHWGIQGDGCPSDDQRRLARTLVDAGADVVAGTHAHRLQGDGRVGQGYVAYGLGNYAWYSPGPAAASQTGVLTLAVRPPADRSGRARVTRAVWDPARIGTDGLPHPMTGADAESFEVTLENLRDCAGFRR